VKVRIAGLIIACVIAVVLIASGIGVRTSTDYTLPTRFVTHGYSVAGLPDGRIGWVDYLAIWVDPRDHVWIAPDHVVSDSQTGDQLLRISREGDHIVLYSDSIGNARWTPGVDTGDHVAQVPGIMPVVVR
jgi:hypothetical protein